MVLQIPLEVLAVASKGIGLIEGDTYAHGNKQHNYVQSGVSKGQILQH